MQVFWRATLLGLAFLTGLALLPGQPHARPAEQSAAPCLMSASQDIGMDYAAPRLAVISPAGAMLEAEQTVIVRTVREGERTVRMADFLLPRGAELTRLEAVGETVLRWQSQPQTRTVTASRRQVLEGERDRLTGELASIQAQRSVWQSVPQNAPAGDAARRVADIREHLPELVRREAELERRLKLLEAELKALPPAQELGQRITLVMQDTTAVDRATMDREAADKAAGSEFATLRYSYNLPDCGWQPVYAFDARRGGQDASGGAEQGSVRVRLMAEIWQHSGLDWADTRLRLVTQGRGAREPRPLPVWLVQAEPEAVLRSEMPLAYKAARSGDLAGVAMNRAAFAAPAHADVALDARGAYAVWEPVTHGLPQGTSRLVLREESWQTPLQWLARPGTEGPCPVWLRAAYTLPPGEVWPAGDALYSVDGQSVGQGAFRPQDGRAELFFGADPRVSLLVTADSRKRGESGFIDKRRVWSWAWTYQITNGHERPITVTLERPAPRIVDADVRVQYEDRPEPVYDAERHLLRWQLEVGARAKADVRHALSITAPGDIPLNPVAP